MKRNWFLIITIILLIVAYNSFVLAPYNKKYAPPPPPPSASANTQNTPTGTTASAAPGAPLSAPSGRKLFVSDTDKKSAEKVEIDSTRSFNLYPDGGIGDVTFNNYFVRGHEIKEPIHIVGNAFHWSSTDPKVNTCLRSFTKTGKFSFSGEADGVKCRLSYEPNKLLVGTHIEVESNSEIKGEVVLETEDGVGEGQQFDHRYLTIKKKDEKVAKVREKDLWKGSVSASGPFDFISWGDKYFSAIIMPKGNFNPNLFYGAGTNPEQRVNWGVAYPLRWSAENTKLSYDLDVYFAIKDLQELRSVRADVADTIDFGFFGAIARFMLWSLEELYKVFKNYGVAIIILSLAIRLLLWPINRKMFESGQKMKLIQPQMEAIKKKYEGKSDQMMQMNNEIRQLYSTAGVNPLGSCLPIFIQIPIFFGLNSALSNSVDLYQAPFFGWITDLSYRDPLYILPVIWTISLIISVELNPQPQSQPGMPDMKWISRAMFLVFGFISKDFPSGLNLYFLVSNLAGMFQQFLFKKKNQATGQSILLGKER
jgi:YidC/Oxa1 family membrane protein insertase